MFFKDVIATLQQHRSYNVAETMLLQRCILIAQHRDPNAT